MSKRLKVQYGNSLSILLQFCFNFAFNFDLRRYCAAFDADVFEATACTQGSDWKAAWGCTRNDPVDRVLIVGSSKASTARGAAVLIATFTLQVRDSFTDAQLSPLSGNIEAMTRGDAVEEASAISAGAGNVKVNGASRRRGLLQLVVWTDG